jgi:hypothetical protein
MESSGRLSLQRYLTVFRKWNFERNAAEYYFRFLAMGIMKDEGRSRSSCSIDLHITPMLRESARVREGDVVLYEYKVVNPSNTVISDLRLEDSDLGQISLYKTTLLPDQTAYRTKSYTVTKQDILDWNTPYASSNPNGGFQYTKGVFDFNCYVVFA